MLIVSIEGEYKRIADDINTVISSKIKISLSANEFGKY
jgi:hypothetical protein